MTKRNQKKRGPKQQQPKTARGTSSSRALTEEDLKEVAGGTGSAGSLMKGCCSGKHFDKVVLHL